MAPEICVVKNLRIFLRWRIGSSDKYFQKYLLSKIWEFFPDGGYCPQTDDGGYLQKGNGGSTWSPLFQLLINNILRKPKYRQSLKAIQNLKSISWAILCKWSSTRISSKIHGWIWENGVRVHSWMSFISKICCSFKNEKSDETESYILLWQKHGSTSIAWFPEKEKSNADYREYWNAKMDCATEWRHIWEDRSGAKTGLGMDGWLQSEEVGGWHLSCTQLLQTTGVPLSALHLDSLCLVILSVGNNQLLKCTSKSNLWDATVLKLLRFMLICSILQRHSLKLLNG